MSITNLMTLCTLLSDIKNDLEMFSESFDRIKVNENRP